MAVMELRLKRWASAHPWWFAWIGGLFISALATMLQYVLHGFVGLPWVALTWFLLGSMMGATIGRRLRNRS
jgi:uncharacterized membrane protein YfcA